MKYIFFIVIVLIVFIGGLSIFLQPNDFIGCPARPEKDGRCAAADAIVVVSGGDTDARTDMGIDLYKNGWARQIVFSGAAQDTTGPSNAAIMKQRALAVGVPEEVISIEGASRTTSENASNTQKLLSDSDIQSVILVTSGYHQRRASIEFKKLADGVEIKNHPVGDDRDWSAVWWLTPRGWWLAGGEAVKIIVTSVQGESL